MRVGMAAAQCLSSRVAASSCSVASTRSWWCSNPIYAPYEQRPCPNQRKHGAQSAAPEARFGDLPVYHELEPLDSAAASGASSEADRGTPAPANKPRASSLAESRPSGPELYYMADEDMVAAQGVPIGVHEHPKGCVYASPSLGDPTLPSAGTSETSPHRPLTPATAVRILHDQSCGKTDIIRRGAIDPNAASVVPAPQTRSPVTSRASERKRPAAYCSLKKSDGPMVQRVTSRTSRLATASTAAPIDAPQSVSPTPALSKRRKQPKMSESAKLVRSDQLAPMNQLHPARNSLIIARSRSATSNLGMPAEMHQFDAIGRRIDSDCSRAPTPSPPTCDRWLTASEIVQAIRQQSEVAAPQTSLHASPTFSPATAASATLQQLRDADFMHGEISRHEAEARLKAFQIGVGDGGDGCWLVRRKSQDGQLFALSLLAPGLNAKPAHYRLQRHTAGSDSVYFSVQGGSGTPVRLICTSPLDVVTVLRSCPLTSSRITGDKSPMLAGSAPVPEALPEVPNAVSG